MGLSKHDAVNKLCVAEYHLKQAHLIAMQIDDNDVRIKLNVELNDMLTAYDRVKDITSRLGIQAQAIDIKEHVFEAITKIEEVGRGFQPALVGVKK